MPQMRLIEGGFEKLCKGCNQWLPEGAFARNKRGLGGRHSRCRGCRKPSFEAHAARRRGAGVVQVSAADRRQLYLSQRGICPLCGLKMFPFSPLHVDHAVPISKGGRHVASNLQIVHAICNLRKGAR